MSEEKGWIKKEIIIAIIGVVVAGFASLLSDTVRGWIKALWGLVKSGWHGLGADVTTYRWLYWLLLLVLVVNILWIVWVIIAANRKPEGPREPTWHDYRADEIFGLKWRWEYHHGLIYEPHPFCPKCDMVMVWVNNWNDTHTVTCERCQLKKVFQGDELVATQNKVKREIDRRLRAGEWRDALKQTTEDDA